MPPQDRSQFFPSSSRENGEALFASRIQLIEPVLRQRARRPGDPRTEPPLAFRGVIWALNKPPRKR